MIEHGPGLSSAEMNCQRLATRLLRARKMISAHRPVA